MTTAEPSATTTGADTAEKPFGMRLVLDVGGCDPDALRSRRALRRFVRTVCDTIGMERYGRCRAKRFALHDPVAAGFTVTQWMISQWITTSSIELHISELRRRVYLSVFSCRSFDPDQVIACVQLELGATETHQRIVIVHQ